MKSQKTEANIEELDNRINFILDQKFDSISYVNKISAIASQEINGRIIKSIFWLLGGVGSFLLIILSGYILHLITT